MPRGRKPKPIQLKLVEGNPGKRKLPHQEITKPRRLRAPTTLSKSEQKIWKHCVKYAPYSMLQHIDAALLYQYVVARAIFDEANKNYQAGPKILKTGNGTAVMSPWYHVLNRQSQLMLSLASELGFTPAARARLGVRDSHEEPDDDDDWFSKYT